MLSTTLFVIYLLLFAILIRKLIGKSFFTANTVEIFIAFSFKIGMACLYGWIFYHYYNGDDTWAMHNASIYERSLLIQNPGKFFLEFTPISAWTHKTGAATIISTYLSDLEYAMQAKTLALVNFLTGNNYYINTIFFSFITFWGHYLLFKLFLLKFPEKRRLLFIIIFLFPPSVFWLSGLRADGLLFLFASMVLYYFEAWLRTEKKSHAALVFIGLTGVLIFRPQIAGLIVPALIAWFISTRYSKQPLKIFFAVYAAGILLFFASSFFSSRSSLPAIVAKKQYDFLALKGNTAFKLDSLKPNVTSYAKVLPQAVSNSFLRPFIWEWKGPLQLVAALETLLLWGLILLTAFRPSPNLSRLIKEPLFLAIIFFSVTLYIFIGYTVPFPGAIVRYRIIAELLLITLLAASIRLSPKRHNKFL